MTLAWKVGKSFSSLRCLRQVNIFYDRYSLILLTELRCENRCCLHKRVNRRTGKNSKTVREKPFPGDTRWPREGTESLTLSEYP